MLAEHEFDRALVIVAHPDDAEFWAGGIIACWTDAGFAVTYCVLTNGETGGYNTSVPREDMARIRRAEQQQAAALLGVTDVRFFGLAEGELRVGDKQLRRELVRLIRQVRPQRVVTWSPEWNWQRFRSCHPDHRATGEITLSAIYPDAGNPFAHLPLREEEGLEAWTVREAWLINSPQANHYVDVTETFERKVAAVKLHHSQTGNRQNLAAELRDRIAANTAAAQLPAGRLAEEFQVVITG
ncbi:MAG: PIG-L family deacetylase [Pseudonocardiales bacterium]|nr:PIG-L family deacetylase [Pseudonocardiales bacterium]